MGAALLTVFGGLALLLAVVVSMACSLFGESTNARDGIRMVMGAQSVAYWARGGPRNAAGQSLVSCWAR